MDVLVINLAGSTERMAFQSRQLAALGLPFERVEAVSADAASALRSENYWESWERPLRPAERACLLSHVAAWETIAARGRPALVLEDDAVLSRRVPALLAGLANMGGLDHVSLEVRGRKKLLGLHPREVAGLKLSRLYQDRTGAAAYVLWPAGADKLVARAGRKVALADALIATAYDLSSWQAEPAQAVQLDVCAWYGLTPPIETRSTIDGVSAARPAPASAQRWRRIAMQLRLALRGPTHLGRARWRRVPLDPSDFR
ncbi:glycosyltransferase family 25 protein [Albidovulum sediminicola]|uniref:Glycosyltransferase family 25 protein n=1 Tax=Albidovulum sediminicola TaxID=2984331 RepID=A0ABT2YYK1_9RHOB|nr:glycosyltransferase family 25 protein [Defluviimonas sp. WL0075]MCV2863857.1 glycosyltransferase family 25 protein [Defluviimonas sp. WL0075]